MVTAETWPPAAHVGARNGDARQVVARYGDVHIDARNGEVDIERDRKLVERAQVGHTEAFDALYECYLARLERYCLRRLNDPYEAQDIAQEAFLRAWKALPSFGGDRRFYPWLSVIASNLCTDSLRRRQRFGPVPVAEPNERELPTSSSTEDSVVGAVDLDLAAQAFTRLSERHRRVLDMRERSGLSYQAIAEREGIRVTTVETLIWRARQAFKREFSALDGSAGLGGSVLGLGFLRRLLRGIRGLRTTRSVGALSTKLAAVSSQGVLVAVGGAVATAAIVVASASGAHHSQPMARAIGSVPRTAVYSATPGSANASRGQATDTAEAGHAKLSAPRTDLASSASNPGASVGASRSGATSSGSTRDAVTESPGSHLHNVSTSLQLNPGNDGVNGIGVGTKGSGSNAVVPPRLLGKTGAVQDAVQKTVGSVEKTVGSVEKTVGKAAEKTVGGVEKTVGGVEKTVGKAAEQTVTNVLQTVDVPGQLANADQGTGDVKNGVTNTSEQVQTAVASVAQQLAGALG
jgi:RNA polymerase sigma-70 factor, ECF subfamily